MWKVIDKTAKNIGEIIDILKELPADYAIVPTGDTCKVAYDDESKAVYVCVDGWIENNVWEMNEEIKENKEK